LTGLQRRVAAIGGGELLQPFHTRSARTANLHEAASRPLSPVSDVLTIDFAELSAEAPGVPTAFYGPGKRAQAGSELHLALPPTRAYDLLVDDVELKCRPATCASIVFAHSPP